MAIEMRRAGHTYPEITEKLNIPKSTISGWTRKIKFSKKELLKLSLRMKQGRDHARYASILSHRKKKMERERITENEALKEFEANKNKSFFLVGIALYWAEGGKRSGIFQVTNSDPELIRFMMKWIRAYVCKDEQKLRIRLFIHKPYAHENLEQFWSKIIGIPASNFQNTIYKPTAHSIKRNPNYKGCIRITLNGGISYLRKALAWQKFLIAYYKQNSLLP